MIFGLGLPGLVLQPYKSVIRIPQGFYAASMRGFAGFLLGYFFFN